MSDVIVLGGTRAIDEATADEVAAAAGASVERFAGDDRAQTAAILSERSRPAGADTVFLATAGDFPDALAGGPAAAAERAPILLTRSDALPESTAEELQRLDPSEVVVLGGVDAVDGRTAEEAGAAADADVTRVAGDDRWETAAAIAERSQPTGGASVYVATGEAFPDALAGSALAGRDGAPILLTRGDALPQPTASALQRLRPNGATVFGGANAVSGGVVRALERQ